MLIAAIVALSLVVYSSRLELGRSRSFANNLVEQTGYIQVRDPSHLHVRQLRRSVPMTWCFQVLAPVGKSFAPNIGEGIIDNDTGYPPKLISGKIVGSGQQGIVTLNLRRIHPGNDSAWILRDFGKINDMGGVIFSDAGRFDWLEQKLETSPPIDEYHQATRKFDNSTPAVLWKQTVNDATDLEEKPLVKMENPRAFMIWLEPIAK